MNEETHHPEIDPQLEARIVALVLGEVSDFEREVLGRMIALDPQLRSFQAEMEKVHAVLEDVGAGQWVAADDDWKLSAERRSLVEATISGQAPQPTTLLSVPMTTTLHRPSNARVLWSFAKAAAVLLGIIGTFAVLVGPAVNSARESASVEGGTKRLLRSESAFVDEGVFDEEMAFSADGHNYFQNGPAIPAPMNEGTPAPVAASTNSKLYHDRSKSALSSIQENVAVNGMARSSARTWDESGKAAQTQLGSGLAMPQQAIAQGSTRRRGGELTVPSDSLGGNPAEGDRRYRYERDTPTDASVWMYNAAEPVEANQQPTQGLSLALPSLPPTPESPSVGKPSSGGKDDRDFDRASSDDLATLGGFAGDKSATVDHFASGMGGGMGGGGIASPVGGKGLPSNSSGPSSAPSSAAVSGAAIKRMLKQLEDLEQSAAEVKSLDADEEPIAQYGFGDVPFGEPLSERSSTREGITATDRGSSVQLDSRASTRWGARTEYDMELFEKENKEVRELGILQDSLQDITRYSKSFRMSGPGDGEDKESDSKLEQNKRSALSLDFGTTSLDESLDDKYQRADVDVWRDYTPPTADNGLEVATKKKAPAKMFRAPEGLSEKSAAEEAFSTFSLHISDVSFQLARSALARGEWPEAAKIRIEEFVNAFDYRDPMPHQGEKVACRIEQSVHPFLQQRNLLRVAMRTAATGRASNTPLRLTLLIDNSGSMERIDRQQTVRQAFTLLAQQLQPADQITLISFARQPRLLADQVSASESNELVQLIDNLPSEGGTNIEAALQLAFEKALQQRIDGGQNRIVLLTDGAVNLGDADPDSLSQMITTMRDSGIAFDAAGICAEGLNDEILEALTRKGDGRYYLLDAPEAADQGFVRQIAGALRPSAKNVKVQVEFNPQRVGRYKLLGFEKHVLNKEDFRNDQVDAAEMAAEEAGVALYQFEAKPDGEGDVGSVSVRLRDITTGQMIENRWPIPYQADAPRADEATPSMRIASAAALLAAKLRGEPLGQTVNLKALANLLAELPAQDRNVARVQQLQTMIQQARQLSP